MYNIEVDLTCGEVILEHTILQNIRLEIIPCKKKYEIK